MKKGILLAVTILSLGLAGCAAFRRPISGGTMETRPIAPADEAKIRAAAAEAEAAAREQQARLASGKTAR